MANTDVEPDVRIISSTDRGNNNKLSIYFVFKKDFQETVVIKAFNKQQAGVGRIEQKVKGKRDKVTYTDFVFDLRTNVGPKYTILIN